MIRLAALGAVVAGIYGAIHDQISYTISDEYFTKLKFHQFSYADFGLPPRVFAAEVGFLASWWVGLIAGWLLARAGLSELPGPSRFKRICLSFAIVVTAAVICGAAGLVLAIVVTRNGHVAPWEHWRQALGLRDVRSFVVVAYLHNGSYLGGLLGFIAAAIYVRRWRCRVTRPRSTVSIAGLSF
jgi:hypothetical protein